MLHKSVLMAYWFILLIIVFQLHLVFVRLFHTWIFVKRLIISQIFILSLTNSTEICIKTQSDL